MKALTVGVVVAAALTVTGCNSGAMSPSAATPSVAPTSVTNPATPSLSAAPLSANGLNVPALDTFRSGDVAFFSRLRLEGAVVTRPPASLKFLRAGSSVTLTASVVDVRAGGMAASTPILEVILKPEKVLHGKLQADSATIRVTTIGLGEATGDAQAAALRAALPQGQSVWFLRWQGDLNRPTKPNAPVTTASTDPDLYALTHAFGVLVQGASHVEAPLTESDVPKDGFVGEVESIGKVSQAITATA